MPGKFIAMRGLPGSGKSTIARELVQRLLATGQTAINLDRDMFRTANGFTVAATGAFEEVITKQQEVIITNALLAGWTVIESSTNLNNRFLKEMLKLAVSCGAEVEIQDVNTDIEICIERDENRRLAGGHFVGEDVIRSFVNRMPKGKFPPKPKLPEAVKGEIYVPNVNNPRAIIVDIDGTVAEINGRSPYDYTLVGTDKPKQWVIDLVEGAFENGEEIIFMSGRDSACFDATFKWLTKHLTVDFKLFMRAEGDTRMDAIVKLELFNEHVRNNYNVLYCVDDRRQVIDMYRSIGLNVLDVAGHNF